MININGNQTYINPNIISDNSLILYLDPANYKSYNSSSSFTDISKFSNNMIISNATGSTENKGVIKSNGNTTKISKTYVTSDEYDISLTNAMTLDVWIKWDAITRALDGGIAFGDIFGNTSLGHLQWQWAKFTVGTSPVIARWSFMITSPGGVFIRLNFDQSASTFTTLNNNTWYNFIYTMDKTENSIKGYVNGIRYDGVLDGTWPATTPIPAASWRHLGVGGRPNGANNTTYGFLGSLGIVKIYNRALSYNEVLQNYNTTKGRYGYI